MAQQETTVHRVVEEVLREIIDDWYKNVSAYYVTTEDLDRQGKSGQEEELKKFHDERGHRIKFNKGDLDFTYGFRSFWKDRELVIEVSVNNKVENFDYSDFQDRLLAYYWKSGEELVPTPAGLRSFRFREIFRFEKGFVDSFTVERREEKADIMRLSFQVESNHLDKLAEHAGSCKQLIEAYCVSPFRTVYATVYRRSPH